MLVTVDKRGGVNLPATLRKDLGLIPGAYLELTIQEGGAIILRPVSIYPAIRLSPEGLSKLDEARKSGTGGLPDWIQDEYRTGRPGGLLSCYDMPCPLLTQKTSNVT